MFGQFHEIHEIHACMRSLPFFLHLFGFFLHLKRYYHRGRISDRNLLLKTNFRMLYDNKKSFLRSLFCCLKIYFLGMLSSHSPFSFTVQPSGVTPPSWQAPRVPSFVGFK